MSQYPDCSVKEYIFNNIDTIRLPYRLDKSQNIRPKCPGILAIEVKANTLKMKNIKLPYFGEINLTKLEQYYWTEIVLNKLTIKLDLNFENESITIDQHQNIGAFLESLSIFDTQNQIQIQKDFNNEGEALDYINFYFDELDEDEINEIIGSENRVDSKEKQLLQKLKLIRVGLYPDQNSDSKNYGVFDYSIDIDNEPCNQVLVINTDRNGNVHEVTWES